MQFSSKHSNGLVHFLNIIKWVNQWVFSSCFIWQNSSFFLKLLMIHIPTFLRNCGYWYCHRRKMDSRKNFTGCFKHWVNLQLSELVRKLFRIWSCFVLPHFGLNKGGFGDLAESFVLERCPRICARPFFLQWSAEFSFCEHNRDRDRGNFFACDFWTSLPSGNCVPLTVVHVVSQLHIHYGVSKVVGFLITFLIQDPKSSNHSIPLESTQTKEAP